MMLDPVTLYNYLQNDITMIVQYQDVYQKIVQLLKNHESITFSIFNYLPFYKFLMNCLIFNISMESLSSVSFLDTPFHYKIGINFEVFSFIELLKNYKNYEENEIKNILLEIIIKTSNKEVIEGLLDIMKDHNMTHLFIYKFLIGYAYNFN